MNNELKTDTPNSSQINLPASYFNLFLQIATEQGLEKNQLLNGANINSSELEETDEISQPDINKIISNIQHLSQHPAIGLIFGEKLQRSSHEVLGNAMMEAPSHIEGLHVFNRFMKLRTNLMTFDLNINKERIHLNFYFTQNIESINRFIIEASLTSTCALTRHLNESDPVISVHFSFEKPDNTQIYNDFFSVPVYYESKRNYIILDRMNNTKTLNPAIYNAAQKQRSFLTSQFKKNTSATDKINYLLRKQPEHFFDQKNLAKQLHISPRSLRRHLKAENTTYQKILDQVRCELAQHYLQKNQWSIDETAELLGYSETANFTRAFRRWTGKTPTKIRSLLLNQEI